MFKLVGSTEKLPFALADSIIDSFGLLFDDTRAFLPFDALEGSALLKDPQPPRLRVENDSQEAHNEQHDMLDAEYRQDVRR